MNLQFLHKKLKNERTRYPYLGKMIRISTISVEILMRDFCKQ